MISRVRATNDTAAAAAHGSPLRVLHCSAVTVSYGGRAVLALSRLDVDRGETVAVLGPSGSGKTTLLYAIAGFVAPDRGRIVIDGQVVNDGGHSSPPEVRGLGVVFQHYALWPHLNALDTVAYPLRRRGIKVGPARRRAAELLELLDVGHLGQRKPSELSGGQQQRVGLARALACEALLYLFDEPTAHLDTPLRQALVQELADRRRASGAAALIATHDAAEALALADRVVVLVDGVVVQVDVPDMVYERPADLQTARLTGPVSHLSGQCSSLAPLGLHLEDGTELSQVADIAPGMVPGPVDVLVRPEWIELGGAAQGVVSSRWYRGAHTDVAIESPAGRVIVRVQGAAPKIDERVGWKVTRAWVLPG